MRGVYVGRDWAPGGHLVERFLLPAWKKTYLYRFHFKPKRFAAIGFCYAGSPICLAWCRIPFIPHRATVGLNISGGS
jgi:hypothetical protein